MPSTGRHRSLLLLALALGLLAYCLVLLLSKQAPLGLLHIAGVMSVVLISASMALLWSGHFERVGRGATYLCALCKTELAEDQEECPGCGSRIFRELTF